MPTTNLAQPSTRIGHFASAADLNGAVIDLCTMDGADLEIDVVITAGSNDAVSMSYTVCNVVGGSDTRNTILGFYQAGLTDGTTVPIATNGQADYSYLVYAGASTTQTSNYQEKFKNVGERIRLTFTASRTGSNADIIDIYATLLT